MFPSQDPKKSARKNDFLSALGRPTSGNHRDNFQFEKFEKDNNPFIDMDAPMNNGNGQGSQAPIDPITLGQIKAAMANSMKPKDQKASWYDYQYDDEDTVMAEIEEFYSYVEMPQAVENLKAWEDSYMPEWMKASPADRRTHVQLLLESLEHKDTEIRTFAETGSPQDQLHWIFENAKVVRDADGISCVVEAVKIASRKHDFLCGLSDQDAIRFNIGLADKANLLEEILTELSVYFGMLYHLIEVFKGHEDFAEEIMSLEPPLPVYLFSIISNLRDKSAKGYPIKKVKLLLLMWKTLLACWGGIRDYARVKQLARELAGLPPVSDFNKKLKTSALDVEQYRNETSVKYPTFTPPKTPPMNLADFPIAKSNSSKLTQRLSQAYNPIPLRHHYHHDDLEPAHTGMLPGQSGFQQHQMGPNSSFRGNPQPPTPAPSPPPSPKPKKQQYQTDQSRPFLLPFSAKKGKKANLVPFAIDEAERLFNKHLYVSLALTQMWRTREDCMTFESGLERMPGMDETYRSSTFLANVSPLSRIIFGALVNEHQEVETEPLPDVAQINREIEAAARAENLATNAAEKRKWRQRREDLNRLKRVEQVYGAVLPHLAGWVLVLLKLLLATVSASTNGLQNPQPSGSSVFPPGVSSPINSAAPGPEQPPAHPPTLEEIDVTRHREITSKAVSAIILIVLKWFKVSHAMKFHHVGHHLLDTNCLLLILKMFGLQEIAQLVVSKADSPENNFFNFCLNYSKNPQPHQPEDNSQRNLRQTATRTVTLPNGEKHEEEVEIVYDYSWRNFFATINYAKIMQKLSKGRPHRIWMLVHYKSSAVLKRVLRVMHPMLQINILKLIKSQVPYCGRRWRQSNMKVITAIYLNCRPDLRDEWLTGNEMEEGQGAQAQEQALRHLVKFYNTKRYGSAALGNQNSPKHRRSGSISQQMDGLHPPELSGIIRPLGTPNSVDADVFPPPRSQAPDPNIFLPYITEDIAFEEEYEEYLKDLGYTDDQTGDMPLPEGTSAWSRLPYTDIADGISDSESVGTIEELDEPRLDISRDDGSIVDENRNNWEHLSPKTMAALPKSPAGRRSSSGNGLRPVMPLFDLDNGSAIDLDDLEESELGPAPRGESTPFAEGASVDEVEYAYGILHTISQYRGGGKSKPGEEKEIQTHTELSALYCQLATNGNFSATETIHAANDRKTTEQCTYRPTIPPSLRYLAHSQSQSESEQGDNDASDSGPASELVYQVKPPSSSLRPLGREVESSTGSQTNDQQFSEVFQALSAIGQLLLREDDDREDSSAESSIRNITKFFSEVNSYFPDPGLSTWLLEYFFNECPAPSFWPVLHKAALQLTSAQSDIEQPFSTNYVVLIAIVDLLSLQSLPQSVDDVSLRVLIDFLAASNSGPLIEQATIFKDYEGDRNLLKTRLCEFSMPLLTSVECLSSQPKLEDIQASLLFSVYHLNDGNYSTAFWISGTSIRMAQQVGIVYRDREDETFRILWYIKGPCFFLIGRFQKHYHMPLPHATYYYANETGGLSDTLVDNKMKIGFLLIQIQWAQLVGEYWDVLSSAKSTIGDLLRLEDTFSRFEAGLPIPFRVHDIPEPARRSVTYYQGFIISLRTYHIRAQILLKLFKNLSCPMSGSDIYRLNKLRNDVEDACSSLCQKILAYHHGALTILSSSFLRWGELSVISFDGALILVALVLLHSVHSAPSDAHITKILSWVMIAQSLLEKAPIHNIQARKALNAIHVLRSALLTAATSNSSVHHRALHFDFDPEMVTLAREQPSLPVIKGLSTEDLPGGILPISISQPEVDLLNCDGFVDRVQGFLQSCAAVGS
ncbi:hypothetical protein NP233_g2951 [Leucocoprinus birnbaumii]|uniref:Uncharacterized protein n=1 Tax=Leucocoprinus birnbaumii TaxID=56174 RepID=A0AAD5VY07_9AGAR|nr:hypothetical protein NP233_g2951 [Leucocoprinus birnbaumii]